MRWLVLGAVLALGVGGAGYWWALSGQRGAASYQTEPVSAGDILVTVTATGTVEPIRVVDVSSELSGVIDAVHVDFNDVVQEGDLLASLNTDELEAGVALAQATLQARESELTLARVNLEEARSLQERTIQLGQRNVATSQQIESANAGVRRAEAALAGATAGVAVASAELDRAQTARAKACICSPIAGMVLERNVSPGQIVAAALQAPVLFRIAQDLSRMELHVDIDEADIGMVEEGDDASFTVEAFRDRHFPATITQLRFAPRIIGGVVSYQAVLSIGNEAMLLRPGMTATAEIVVDRRENVLRVPNAALRYSPEREDIFNPDPVRSAGDETRTVWVLAEGRPAPLAIVPGASDGAFTVIESGDLAVGTPVITGEF